MPGKAESSLADTMDNIPDSKLIGLPTTETTLYSDTNFRLDMQKVSRMASSALHLTVIDFGNYQTDDKQEPS